MRDGIYRIYEIYCDGHPPSGSIPLLGMAGRGNDQRRNTGTQGDSGVVGAGHISITTSKMQLVTRPPSGIRIGKGDVGAKHPHKGVTGDGFGMQSN
jgi:hypothetical protein